MFLVGFGAAGKGSAAGVCDDTHGESVCFFHTQLLFICDTFCVCLVSWSNRLAGPDECKILD